MKDNITSNNSSKNVALRRMLTLPPYACGNTLKVIKNFYCKQTAKVRLKRVIFSADQYGGAVEGILMDKNK